MNTLIESTLSALHHQCIPVIRSQSLEEALWIAHQMVQVGFQAIEFTLSTPDVFNFFQEERPLEFKNVVCGLGTLTQDAHFDAIVNVVNPPDFIASPAILPKCLHPEYFIESLKVLDSLGILYLAGAATPSEVLYALASHVPAIKWFPAEAMGGVRTLKTLLAPFPEAKLIPFGGVNPEQVEAYWQAGAWAVGIGHYLMPSTEILKNRDAQAYRQYLANAFQNIH